MGQNILGYGAVRSILLDAIKEIPTHRFIASDLIGMMPSEIDKKAVSMGLFNLEKKGLIIKVGKKGVKNIYAKKGKINSKEVELRNKLKEELHLDTTPILDKEFDDVELKVEKKENLFKHRIVITIDTINAADKAKVLAEVADYVGEVEGMSVNVHTENLD
jgi:hypothetical protein